jgi:hypothetical protein
MCRRLFYLIPVLVLTFACTSQADLLIGDFEDGLGDWTLTWEGTSTIDISNIGATSGSQSLVLTAPTNAFSWAAMWNGLVDLENCHTISADITWVASEWEPESGIWVNFKDLAINSDGASGWQQYIPTDAANPDWPGSWDPNNWGDQTRTLTWDVSNYDATGATWMQVIFSTNMGNVTTAGNYYIDNVQLLGAELLPTGPDIIWVSDAHDLLNPGGDPDDQGWVDLLKSQPEDYDVKYPKNLAGTGPWQGELSTELIQELNKADLVIVSRDASSGGHNQPDIWNKIGTPVILLSNYIARSSRWQWVDSTSINARQEYYDLQAADPEHPVFDGVELDPNGQVVWFDPEAGSGFAGFLADVNDAGNGNMIATRPDDGTMLIAEWDTGVNFYEGTDQAPLAKRMLFCAGTQEDANNLHYGSYNLSAEGEKMFLNAVRYMMTNKPSDPSVDGLVAHYELENDAVDSSGNGLDGVLMGEPNFAEGIIGMALDADGVDDYIDCSNDVSFDMTEQITVSAWLNLRSINTAWQAAVAKGENAWRLGNVNEDPRFHFGITIWNAPDTASIDGETAFELGEWHNVIGRFDGRNINVYVDGMLDGTVPTTVPIGTNTTSMFIGDNPEATGRYWDGLIDDVMIFNRAITPGEMRYLLGDRVTEDPDADGLVAYYEMENNANDSSGNGRDGTICDGSAKLYIDGDYVEGPEGMAISFNGANQRVCVGNDSAFNLPGSFSISMWAKIGARSEFMGNSIIGNKALNSQGWSVHQYAKSDKLSFTTMGVTSDMDGVKYRMPTASSIPLNEWHQIIMIFDSENGEKLIYLDGVLDVAGKIAAGSSVSPSGYKTYIGARSNDGGTGGDRYFKGALDDIRIHNKALSLAEVLYLAGLEEFNVFDY